MLNTYWQMILGQKKVRNMELGGWKTNSKIAHRFFEHTMSKKNRILDYLIVWDLGCRFPQADLKGEPPTIMEFLATPVDIVKLGLLFLYRFADHP